MVDLFEEVEEELRVEQYKKLALMLAPWLAGLVAIVLVVGGGWLGYQAWSDGRMAKSAQSYQAALDMMQRGDTEGAFSAFAAVAEKATPIYKSFALTQQAGIRLAQGRNADAAALFVQSADAAPKSPEGQIFADLARLKSARAVLDTAPYADLEARLKPLTEARRPFSPLAREDLAWAKLRAGKTAEARSDFVKLQTMLEGPRGQDGSGVIQQRAAGAIALIDSGAGADLPKMIETIRNLPPPAPAGGAGGLTPEMIQQLMQQQGGGAGAGGPPQ